MWEQASPEGQRRGGFQLDRRGKGRGFVKRRRGGTGVVRAMVVVSEERREEEGWEKWGGEWCEAVWCGVVWSGMLWIGGERNREGWEREGEGEGRRGEGGGGREERDCVLSFACDFSVLSSPVPSTLPCSPPLLSVLSCVSSMLSATSYWNEETPDSRESASAEAEYPSACRR